MRDHNKLRNLLEQRCQIPSIDKGSSEPRISAAVGQSVVFFCEIGYTLSGDETNICGSNGRLEKDLPTCTKRNFTINHSFFYIK